MILSPVISGTLEFPKVLVGEVLFCLLSEESMALLMSILRLIHVALSTALTPDLNATPWALSSSTYMHNPPSLSNAVMLKLLPLAKRGFPESVADDMEGLAAQRCDLKAQVVCCPFCLYKYDPVCFLQTLEWKHDKIWGCFH